MILFINGPFGIGKTTAAKLVVSKIERAVLFDPEIIGNLLFCLLKKVQPVGDFQEYSLWPMLTVLTARVLVLGRPVIIPMTIANKSRWEYITKELRRVDGELMCVRLVCSEQTLRERIMARPEAEGNHEWCLTHIQEGLALMADDAFGQAIDTEGRTPTEITDALVSVFLTRKR